MSPLPSGWVLHHHGTDTYDMVPTRDHIQHEDTDDCVCGPETAIRPREGLSDLHLRRHHSLDGREHREAS